MIPVLLTALSALACGAVYPSGYVPLLAGCGAFGLWSIVVHRRALRTSPARPIALSVSALVLAVALQLVPLSRAGLQRLTPHTDTLLSTYSLGYDAAPAGQARHPLSIDPDRTRLALAFLIVFGIYLVGLILWLQHDAAIATVVRGVLVTTILLSLIAIVQQGLGSRRMYGIWAPVDYTDPFGPFVNRNHFAGWMLMSVALGLGYMCVLLKRDARRLAGGWRNTLLWFGTPAASELMLVAFTITVATASVILSASRSGAAGLGIVVLTLGLAMLRAATSAPRRLVVAGFLCSFAVLGLGWTGATALQSRLGNPNVDGRLGPWRDARGVITRYPLTGTGINTYRVAMLFYQTIDPDHIYSTAHNDYLQVLAEGGALVAIPAVIVVLIVANETRRRFGEHGGRGIEWIRVGAATGLAAIALQEVGDFSLQIPADAAFFCLMCAIAVSRQGRPRHPAGSRLPR